MIECWVTGPAGASDYRGHLDRSQASPFRKFAVSRMRGADPGVGSLEYHRDNALVADNPGLFADGSLVWMKYRGHTLTWIVEERKAVLDDSENATDWIAVSGRGVKQLLADRTVWPSAFSESALDPSAWGPDAQWYRVINRAAGEMCWDMIAASNPRFATQLVRGTIETSGSDGWTQDFRFDTLLDVVSSVTAAYGDVELDGLTFNYRNHPGTDRSASVIFEEGGDILRVERMTSDRDTLSWIVAEGVGEGVIAKLATATDATIGRRREGYLDAKDAGNLPLVQLRANAALDEFKPVDSIALEVTEERFAAFTDYDLWDTVRTIAPSRDIDELGIIVALYLAEGDDERIRVGFDVNSPRQEYLIKLAAGNRSTANSVGVRNRMPQGNLQAFPIIGQGEFDTDDTLEVHFWLPDEMKFIVRCKVAIDFRPFKAPAKSVSAASSGTLTSASGGSSSPTSDAALIYTTHDGDHDHVETSFPGNTLSSGGHQHTAGTNGTSHSHDVTIAGHTHTVSGHTHALTIVYGIQSEAYPGTHSAIATLFELVGGSWTLRATIGGLTGDREEIDLTPYVSVGAQWRLDLQSAGGQPNGGRLAAYVSGHAFGAIATA